MEPKKQLEEMRIRPAENGGHLITHEFKRSMKSEKLGDIGYSRPPSEEHVFGPQDGAKMMAHISKHLGRPMKGSDNDGD